MTARRSFRLGGAWIETKTYSGTAPQNGVAPSGWEGRGLKLHSSEDVTTPIGVAPSGWEGRGLKPQCESSAAAAV